MSAPPLDLPLEYVRLGLRFDRLEPGFVDAFTGDPGVRAQVADEPAPTPSGLRDQARTLLRELDAAGLPADRADYLRGQLTGLECSARKMSGEPVAFVDEVAAYFQVDVELGDPASYAAAHAELEALLPGGGSLAERYAHHRRREECPPQRLEVAVHAVSSALRDRVRGSYGLPEVETVRYEVVTDQPWSGFNYYEGDYRSRVAINADLPHRLGQLPHLVAHEAYPGHHTEHCRKERGLVERDQHLEHTVFLVNTPECLMAELLARLRVMLRRVRVGAAEQLTAGDVTIDLRRYLVFRGGQEVHLTPTEFDLLRVLASEAGRVLTHRQLLERVWGNYAAENSQQLRVYINYLRRKLEEDPRDPQLIVTEPGVGYRLKADLSPLGTEKTLTNF